MTAASIPRALFVLPFLLLVSAVAARGAPEGKGAPSEPAAATERAAGSPSKKGTRATSWYAATVADSEQGFLMVHFWSKGPRLRTEAVIAGRRVVTIVNGKSYYILDLVSGNGVVIERSEVAVRQDEGRERPFANELRQLLIDGGELIGSEESRGRTVDVYRVTNSRGRRTVWVSTAPPQVPLRVETFDRATGKTGRIEYVNWLYNPKLPDSFFEPDPRLRLEKYSYERYKRLVGKQAIGPAPVLYRHLLHGN